MAITNPAKRLMHRSGPSALGPQVTFAAAVLTAFAALAVATTTLPSDLVLPVVSTLFFILAGLVALVAWSRGRAIRARPVDLLGRCRRAHLHRNLRRGAGRSRSDGAAG